MSVSTGLQELRKNSEGSYKRTVKEAIKENCEGIIKKYFSNL